MHYTFFFSCLAYLNNVCCFQTGGADSASGGSGGSGMECMQLRSQPEPFHYLISEQAKSLVALQVSWLAFQHLPAHVYFGVLFVFAETDLYQTVG